MKRLLAIPALVLVIVAAKDVGRVIRPGGEPLSELLGPSFSMIQAAAGAQSVSAGKYHTCGLTAEGAAYCWGANNMGQLGNGTGVPVDTVSNQACVDSLMAEVAAGTVTDRVEAQTRLASCTTITGATPRILSSDVPVAVSGGLTFQSVSAGDEHSCGVTTAGAAYCWGSNNQFGAIMGQLGDGTNREDSDVPVAVVGGHTFRSVSAGGLHSCGVTTAGAAYCWGNNGSNQLGAPITGSTVPVAVTGGQTFLMVSAGLAHTCGVTTVGAAYCWGRVSGIATVPGAVSGGHTFRSVSAGVDQTCGVTTAGDVYCWGFIDLSRQFSRAPVLVPGGHTFQSVSAGGLMGSRGRRVSVHNCGVTTAGAAYCWGGSVREVGYYSNVPVAVAGGHTFQFLSAGGFQNCGVTTTGAAYCFGTNVGGSVGAGNVPVAVPGGITFATNVP